jgi:hypothetical protein
MKTIQSAAIDLACEFTRQLTLGLESPASLVEYYNDNDDALRLEVKFSEYGGGADPNSEPYRLYIDEFDFYHLVGTKWELIAPNTIGITKEDLLC